MKFYSKIILSCLLCVLLHPYSQAQLQIIPQSTGQALVDRLLGQGVTVTNITLTGHPAMTGYFNNLGGTNIGIDSGIVLTNGRAKTTPTADGMDGNGIATAGTVDAFNGFNFPGDGDLSLIVGDVTKDACVLEFDFVPLGDSIKFNYVFSSEEYTLYSCSLFNDAFAFFISGPGILGVKNIALIPGTNLPVTINNINPFPATNPGGCALYPQYYRDNLTNTWFNYDGHTSVFTATERVQPCQVYHLKLVIADVHDDNLDSGVFLEAKSLSSNAIAIINNTQLDPQNNSYLVEGCSLGAFKIKRPQPDPSPLTVNLSYAGTAISGVDYQPLPLTVVIPPAETEVLINVTPIIDNLPEGVETIKIYALAGCTSGLPTDSTVIQIRDYDTLGIAPDTAFICRNNSIQLTATTGYSIYQWDPDPTLSNTNIRNPVATPVNNFTTYYCTGTEGTCHGRDSAFVQIKMLDFISKTEINCKNGATGTISVDGGPEWTAPVEYSINNGAWQPTGDFGSLPVGIYKVKIRDATGCMDSVTTTLTQLYPDLIVSNAPTTPASCTGAADGSATINANGGKMPYLYSTDGVNFQSSNVFNLTQGNYTVTVKDANNCTTTQNIFIPLDNIVSIDAGPDKMVCIGRTVKLGTVSNANSFLWSPAAGLDDITLSNPVASPAITTKYKVIATIGICNREDSMTVLVYPSPIADAGPDLSICYGQDAQLSGSGGVSFFWFPSSYLDDRNLQNPVAQHLPGTITYYLTVTDANGCTSLARDQMTVTVTRPAKLYAGRDTVLAIGQTMPLFAIDVNNSGFIQYEWLPHFGLNDPYSPNPIATGEHDTYYTVTAKTAIGCEASAYLKIKVYKGPEIYVPTAFTPNRDGLNDILRAIPVGIGDFHYFRIWDRWGTLLFNTDNASVGWDGRIKGTEQPTATYVWMAEGIDYKGNLVQRKGTVTILK